jgi:predicted DsbA family dithiol-disulfide isomerase
MRIDVWADITCPWCYIGMARFGTALREFEHRDEVGVAYRSFELDPSQPAGQTRPVLDMLAGKYGLSRADAAEAEGRWQPWRGPRGWNSAWTGRSATHGPRTASCNTPRPVGMGKP